MYATLIFQINNLFVIFVTRALVIFRSRGALHDHSPSIGHLCPAQLHSFLNEGGVEGLRVQHGGEAAFNLEEVGDCDVHGDKEEQTEFTCVCYL